MADMRHMFRYDIRLADETRLQGVRSYVADGVLAALMALLALLPATTVSISVSYLGEENP